MNIKYDNNKHNGETYEAPEGIQEEIQQTNESNSELKSENMAMVKDMKIIKKILKSMVKKGEKKPMTASIYPKIHTLWLHTIGPVKR